MTKQKKMKTETIINNVSKDLKNKYGINSIILALKDGNDAASIVNMEIDDVVTLITLFLEGLRKNNILSDSDLTVIYTMAVKGIDETYKGLHREETK